jgi:hypothetical protein
MFRLGGEPHPQGRELEMRGASLLAGRGPAEVHVLGGKRAIVVRPFARRLGGEVHRPEVWGFRHSRRNVLRQAWLQPSRADFEDFVHRMIQSEMLTAVGATPSRWRM